MPNPFPKDFKPTVRETNTSEVLKLQFPDDWFNLKITDISDIFEKTNTNDDGVSSVSETYVITGTVLDHNLTPWRKKGERNEIQPPAEGEKGVYFHPVGKTTNDKYKVEWKEQNLQEAIKAAGVSGLVVGDELGVLFHRIHGRSNVYEYVVKPTGKRDKPAFPGK